MLSDRTIAEMKAGAEQLAKHAGRSGVDETYMEAMIRTQQRAAWLKRLEQEGEIRIERIIRPCTSMKVIDGKLDYHVTVVHVGDETFDDPNGELVGAWPSEVLVARVALALGAQNTGDAREPG